MAYRVIDWSRQLYLQSSKNDANLEIKRIYISDIIIVLLGISVTKVSLMRQNCDSISRLYFLHFLHRIFGNYLQIWLNIDVIDVINDMDVVQLINIQWLRWIHILFEWKRIIQLNKASRSRSRFCLCWNNQIGEICSLFALRSLEESNKTFWNPTYGV